MARNQRRVEGEVTYSWIAIRLVLFVMIVGVMLGILFLKNRHLAQGEELRALERELKVAQEKTVSLEAQLAKFKTPRELEAKVISWNLGMVHPAENQIRRVQDRKLKSKKTDKRTVLAKADPPKNNYQVP